MSEKYTYRGYEIPPGSLEDIKAYVQTGRDVGHFLTAVISNDLMSAVRVGDIQHKHNIQAFVYYLCEETPEQCYGSYAKFYRWLELGGLDGIAKKEAQDKQPPPDDTPPQRYA